MPKDWRADFVICEHVAADELKGTRHYRFTVCCEDCYTRGFVDAELSVTLEPGGLYVGRFKEGAGARG